MSKNQTSNAQPSPNAAPVAAVQSGPDVAPIDALNIASQKAQAMFRILSDRIIAEIEGASKPANPELEGLCALIDETSDSLEAARDGVSQEWGKWVAFHNATNKAA